jgi:energy-coupling factor transport system permease protein
MHPLAWVAWLVSTLVALSATRNPLYLTLVLLSTGMVKLSLGPSEGASGGSISLLRFGLVIVPFSALFNALIAHFGTHVILRLPAGLPVIGGIVTLEGLVFGAINGLILLGILAAFTTLIQALPIRALTGMIPRAFHPVAVVVSIAVTFVPTTLTQFQQIREAQALRGHRMRGLHDWGPLFMPLLIGGLERALQLAEAMTARGFAGTSDTEQDTTTRLAMLLGMALLLAGWLLRLVWGQEVLGFGLLLAAISMILGALWRAGRRYPRTTYRRQPWTGWDWAVLLGAALVLAVFLLPGIDRLSLFYTPYPVLSLPAFDPWIGIAILGLLAPALYHLGHDPAIRNLGAPTGPHGGLDDNF